MIAIYKIIHTLLRNFFKELILIKKILAFFRLSTKKIDVTKETRRRHVRHPGFNAEVVIEGRTYVAYDWSMSGIAFKTGDTKNIKEGDDVRVTLNFKFPGNTISIAQTAHIIRSLNGTTAIEFEPLPSTTHNEFNKVLDNLYTQSFIESQIAG